jgi:hypothetical protein
MPAPGEAPLPDRPVAVGIGGLGVLADIGGLRSSVVGRVNAAETREVVIDNYKFAPADHGTGRHDGDLGQS